MSKRIISLLAVLAMLIGMLSIGSLTAFAEEGWQGETDGSWYNDPEADLYYIATPAQYAYMVELANDMAKRGDDGSAVLKDKTFVLTADLDFNNYNRFSITMDSFAGKLDGRGHVMKNMYVIDDDGGCGLITNNLYGTVMNLVLEGKLVAGGQQASAIAHVTQRGGIITNCAIKVNVNTGSKMHPCGVSDVCFGIIANVYYGGTLTGSFSSSISRDKSWGTRVFAYYDNTVNNVYSEYRTGTGLATTVMQDKSFADTLNANLVETAKTVGLELDDLCGWEYVEGDYPALVTLEEGGLRLRGITQLIETAEKLTKDPYSKDSWDNFQSKLTAAKKVLADAQKSDTTVTQEQVDTAYAELEASIEALIDLTTLRSVIAEAEELKEETYGEGKGWKDFAAKRDAAKKTVAKDDVTKEEVEAATLSLSSAKFYLLVDAEEYLPSTAKNAYYGEFSADFSNVSYSALATITDNKLSEPVGSFMSNPPASAFLVVTFPESTKVGALVLGMSHEYTDEGGFPTNFKAQYRTSANPVNPTTEWHGINGFDGNTLYFTAVEADGEKLIITFAAPVKCNAVLLQLNAAGTEPVNIGEIEVYSVPVNVSDKTALQAAIDEASELKKEDYTAESWKAFSSALTKAKTAAGNDDIAQADVDAALKALQDAQAALEEAEETAAIGDVNGDGEINASDATRVLLAIVGKIELDEAQSAAADVTGDGEVNAMDATRILLHSVGKITLE